VKVLFKRMEALSSSMARFQRSRSGPAIALAYVNGPRLIVVDASADDINASAEALP